MPEYERLERLGAGAFGEVWLVYDHALGVQRAVKYVLPSRIHGPTEFYREPRILLQLRHDYIVRVEDAGREAGGSLYISMEYLPEGSVEKKYKGRPLPLSVARRLICGVCWGLQYAHDHGYIHRDIKPANILIASDGRAKLGDFGLAAQATGPGGASPYGYITHLAPEVLEANTTNTATDIYALGVTAYRFVNGDSYLPTPDTLDEFRILVRNGDYPDRTRYRPYVPKHLRQVINKAMNVDPGKRFRSAADFRQALEKVRIKCDWETKPGIGGVVFTTKLAASRVRVMVRRVGNGLVSIDTSKGAAGKLRRVSKDCQENLTMDRGRIELHKILVRFVTKGR